MPSITVFSPEASIGYLWGVFLLIDRVLRALPVGRAPVKVELHQPVGVREGSSLQHWNVKIYVHVCITYMCCDTHTINVTSESHCRVLHVCPQQHFHSGNSVGAQAWPTVRNRTRCSCSSRVPPKGRCFSLCLSTVALLFWVCFGVIGQREEVLKNLSILLWVMEEVYSRRCWPAQASGTFAQPLRLGLSWCDSANLLEQSYKPEFLKYQHSWSQCYKIIFSSHRLSKFFSSSDHPNPKATD